jgi:tRNA dimethylallyltransferase
MKFLISIVGPTGVGKTSLSLFLAKKYKTEIISSDSRQMYRHMDIGTAKPNRKVLEAIPHHFIDSLDPDEPYSAGRFEVDAENLLKRLFEKHDVVIVVGGSTLYISALWHGMDDMPKIPEEVRSGLNAELEEKGLEALVQELAEVDPETHRYVDKKNPARVKRALEVFRATGKPISDFRKGKKKKETYYRHIKVGLRLDRPNLYKRINYRAEQMARKGLADEVRKLLKMGYGPELNSMQSIGYQEMIPFIEGKTNFFSAVKLMQRNSRRYAKRQFNWYRRFPDIKWFEASKDREEEIADWVAQAMAQAEQE